MKPVNDYSHRLYGIEFMLEKDMIIFVIDTRTGQVSEHKAQELNVNTELLYAMPPQDIHSIVTLATKEDCEKMYRYMQERRLQMERKRERQEVIELEIEKRAQKKKDTVQYSAECSDNRDRQTECNKVDAGDNSSGKPDTKDDMESHDVVENVSKRRSKRKMRLKDRVQRRRLLLYDHVTMH